MGTDAIEGCLREMHDIWSTGGQVSERIGKGGCGWGDGWYNVRNSRGGRYRFLGVLGWCQSKAKMRQGD